jgi:hypothetical protein
MGISVIIGKLWLVPVHRGTITERFPEIPDYREGTNCMNISEIGRYGDISAAIKFTDRSRPDLILPSGRYRLGTEEKWIDDCDIDDFWLGRGFK